MNHFISICLLSITLFFIVKPTCAQSDTKADEQTLTLLKQFRKDYIRSKSERKPQLVESYYAADIRLMPEFQKTIITKSNVMRYENAFINRFDISNYQRTEKEIMDVGTRVIEIGAFKAQLILKEDKQTQDVTGKYMDVWKKENGKLTLITQAWNYDHGLSWEDKLKFMDVTVTDVALQSHVPITTPVSFELAALNRLMEKTISEHDENIWLQFYTEDGSFMYSRTPIVKGKNELKDFLHHHVAGLPVFEKLDVRNDRIDDLGKYVIEYASHIAIIRSGDFSGIFTGKDLAIWRREPNGSLKIFRHIGMYD